MRSAFDRGVAGHAASACRELMGSKSRSRMFRVSDQPITMGTRICIQYRYKFHRRARDSSQMCDNKFHAHRRLARRTRTRKAHGKAQSGRDRARPLRARAPDPGADDTRVSRCPRRYARCSWTRRCVRAMICDRAASRSASSRRARVEWVCKGRAAHTCSSTMPMWYSAPQASRGSADPLEPA